ncbi:MAG: DIP1984 family protein [Clostridia bacterium]|nr:DIP1984 family protein [Clostridia bacterium]
MKLAEALQLRSDLMHRLQQLDDRLSDSAKVQEGLEPPENPEELLQEQDQCYAELESLIARINLTNSRTRVEGKTLTELLARRDILAKRIESLRSVCSAALDLSMRQTRTEIRWIATVDVRGLRKQIDQMSAELRTLDTAIQSANWRIELK